MRLINRKLGRGAQLGLAALPFAVVASLYGVTSAARLTENASDKLLPGLPALADAVRRMGPTHAPAAICCGPIRWPVSIGFSLPSRSRPPWRFASAC